VDMVLNHSSSQHPYFQAALHDTTSPYRSWYRWSATKPAERGPWGQDVWVKSPVRDEYYYAVFYSGMPDLNYGNAAVVEEAKKIGRFWLRDMHVDGFRLDAVSYLSEDHGRLQHSPGTHAVLHDYEQYLRGLKLDVFTVGEVYAPIDTVLPYYPDQLVSYFAFEVADSIVAGVARGSAPNLLAPALRLQRDAPAGRWSPFLRNHDQPRTRSELGGDMAKTKLATLLLLTMPSMPFLYYGEEIGMTGTKPDERLRTPMQWTSAPGAGFTQGRPWERLADDSATITVAQEDNDPSSLLNLTRRLIHLRDSHPALSSGTIVPLETNQPAVTAYLRRSGTHAALVVANLGNTPLDRVTLAAAAGALPAGQWTLHDLLGATHGAPWRIERNGAVSGYVPVATLAPKMGYLFELAR
jgi:alpha-amylase